MPVHLLNHATQGSSYPVKGTPVNADELYIGDSADSKNTKVITIADLNAALGVDTSITAGSLATASGNRTANFGGNTLTFNNMTTALHSSTVSHTIQSPTLIVNHPTSATPGQIELTDNDDSATVGFISPGVVTAATLIQLPAGAGSTGEHLEITGINGSIMETDWLAAATDTSITVGTLGAATGARTANFNTNSLLLNNMTTFDAVASGVTSFETTVFEIDNPTGSVGGEIRLRDGADAEDVSFRAAPSMSGTYKVILPTAQGTANQVMHIASVSTDELTMGWTTTGGSDTFLGSTDQTLTANRLVTMTDKDLSLTSTTGNVILTGGDFAKVGVGATFMRVQSPDASWWALQVDNNGALSSVASGAP